MLEKRKRGFFNEPVGPGSRADGGAMVERLLLAPDPAYARARPRPWCERAVSDWRDGRQRHAPLLLSLVMLELWLGDYLPRAFALADGPVRSAA